MPKPQGLHIDRFIRGLVTNRAAISVPSKVGGLGGVVKYYDALIDGSNVEITPSNTLARRPGYPKYSTATFNAETPKGFYSGILNGTAYKLFDTDSKVYQFDTTSLTSIYTKGGTGQTSYQQVGNQLFFSDGNANKKWDGTTVTNAGIAAPTAAPTITNLNLWDTVGASQTCHAWVPSAVYNNTTGSPQQYFLLAPTGEVQWAVVPAGATLKSQNSAPNWATGFGLFGFVTNDGTMTWVNIGTEKTWAANSTAFNASAYLTNAPTIATVAANNTNCTTSGSTSNNWSIASLDAGFNAGASGNTNTLIVTGLGLSVPTGSTVTGVQVTLLRAGKKANLINDVTVQLLKAGVAAGSNKALSGFWPVVKTTSSTNVNGVIVGSSFTGTPTVYGSNTDLWGASLSPSDIASSGFGVQIVANSNAITTSAGAIYFPITISVSYAVSSSGLTATTTGSVVKDKNGNLQVVTTSGTTGAGPGEPSWSTTVGGATTDNTVTWKCLGTANTLPALFNWTYAYGFHTATAAGTHISNMSPLLTLQAPIVGPNVPITGFGTADTQCDSVDLYRTVDAGSTLLYDSSTANVNATTSWTINDTALDTDLNALIQGPVALANNPPVSGMTLLSFHMGRMWGAVGNTLYFSAGPDCINGDGNQAWPPANVFTFSGPVTGLAATSDGLVVFTPADMSIVMGGPQKETFWVQPLRKNFGLQSRNCLAQDGNDLAVYTSSRQFFSFSGQGQTELGFDISGTLAANFDPTLSYVTIHRSGQDQGVFISNGSTKVLRFNLNAGSWDALATPGAGIGPMMSIDTTIGTRSLVSTAGGFIVARDTTTFSDSGSAYAAYATIGSLLLSDLGDAPAKISSVLLASAATGTALTVGVLLNEISGSFTNIPKSNSDPPQLSGTAYASSTLNMDEYQWLGAATPLPIWIKHIQVKITMSASDTVKNEVYGVSLSPP
jgi:hypothetical protein